jgi:hypothetical protein
VFRLVFHVLFDGQEWLVSLLDIRDLLALRLVSRKIRDWVDAFMSKHPSKAFTLYINENASLAELVKEVIAHGIPFFRRLYVGDSSFFSHHLLPSFLLTYGTQIHTVIHYAYGDSVVSEELAFYEALPNLTQLSANWLGDNVADVKMPALKRFQLHKVPSEDSELAAKINFNFLLNFSNLTHLWLPYCSKDDYLEAMSALGQYFAIRNGWKGSTESTLTISFYDLELDDFDDELIRTEGVSAERTGSRRWKDFH